MKKISFLTLLVAAFEFVWLGSAPLRADIVPQTEVYGTASDGTLLHWDVYTPAGTGPWRAVLVIHGGGFVTGSPDSASESILAAKDLAN